MKRMIVASLLTAAALFGGFGCVDDASNGEAEEPAARISPAPPGAEEAPEPAGEDAEEAPAGDAGNDTAATAEEEAEPLVGEILPPSDDRPLENSDLAALDNWHLTLARNEIYARHGRPFQNEDIRAHFEGLPWYTSDSQYTDAWLSLQERENADFILKYQELKYDIPAIRP